jgi:hypothetical protein
MAKKIPHKKLLLIAIPLIILLGGGAVYAYQKKHTEKPADPVSTQQYSGTTDQEKDATESRKQQLIEENNKKTTPDTNTGVKPVAPVITTANQNGQDITITAYTPGVFENGGTCTLTATNGSSKVIKTSEAFANATTTDCAPFFMKRTDFPTVGSWQLVVNYHSSKAEGNSATKVLTVQ